MLRDTGILILLIGLLNGSCDGPSPGEQVFIKQAYGEAVVDGYWIYVPKNYNENEKKKYPVLLFLTGGRKAATSNIYDAKEEGPAKFLNDQNVSYELRPYLRDSFLIVNPHMKVGGVEVRQWFQYSNELIYALHQLDLKYPIDWDRVYITGISRGAHGA
jgi:predicted peptidase